MDGPQTDRIRPALLIFPTTRQADIAVFAAIRIQRECRRLREAFSFLP